MGNRYGFKSGETTMNSNYTYIYIQLIKRVFEKLHMQRLIILKWVLFFVGFLPNRLMM